MNISVRNTPRARSGSTATLIWQHFVSLSLIIVLPGALIAEESGAMLRTSGAGVQVNKNGVPASIALMRNDVIETQTGVTRIETTGSTADVDSDTMLQFGAEELALDHGHLSVNTSRGLRVRVGCLTITPVSSHDWTLYDVVDREGKVTISALKSDVYLDARSSNVELPKKGAQSNRSTVREKEHISRVEDCGAADLPNGSGVTAAEGGFLNNPWVVGGAAIVVGGVGVCIGTNKCWPEDPISPDKPK